MTPEEEATFMQPILDKYEERAILLQHRSPVDDGIIDPTRYAHRPSSRYRGITKCSVTRNSLRRL